MFDKRGLKNTRHIVIIFRLSTLKDTAITVTMVILDFSTQSSTKLQILTPKRYPSYYFIWDSPPPLPVVITDFSTQSGTNILILTPERHPVIFIWDSPFPLPPAVILDFSPLSGTNLLILTPERYDEHPPPRSFSYRSPSLGGGGEGTCREHVGVIFFGGRVLNLVFGCHFGFI